MRPMTLSTPMMPGAGRQTPGAAALNARLQGRYGAARSLDLVRFNIQNLVNKDIDCLLKKYLDKYFQPALINIRKNLGEDSVTEQNLRVVCIQMLDDAKAQYCLKENTSRKFQPALPTQVPGKNSYPSSYTPTRSPLPNPSLSTEGSPVNDTADLSFQCYPSANPSYCMQKGREAESDLDQVKVKKKIMRTVTSIYPGAPTPIKVVKLEGIRREGPKWNPNRITSSTLFIMGARANKVLGFGQTRGRLYTKHPELLKYSGDTEDKEWLSRNNLMPPTGGIAYLLILEDIKELAESADYRNNPNVLLHELKGFHAPDFMLFKIRTFISRARTEGREDVSYQYYDPNLLLQGINYEKINSPNHTQPLLNQRNSSCDTSVCDVNSSNMGNDAGFVQFRSAFSERMSLPIVNRPDAFSLEYF